MHVFLFLLILLAFPVLEIWLLIELADNYGWSLLGYLLIVAILGWRLILDEKLMIFGRVAQTLSQGGTPAKVLFGSAKNMIAGILLIIPGVITDVFAVLLLLIPSPKPLNFEQESTSGFEPHTRRRTGTRSAANDDVIEGEFKRED
ncbi:MAG: FxsA family protein [Methylophilaceae bacterium]|nr:FxsA family protein [Methylophilaceae bacterium]